MANTLLTPTAVTREALRILHQKSNFIGSINRQYDDSFANEGAKIGDSLKIRLPNEYTVRTGKTIQAQDTSEASTTLTMSTLKGVDFKFSSKELTLDMDMFSQRVLEPAMARLAAQIESDALSMYKDVYYEISDVGDDMTIDDVLNSQRKLTEALAPLEGRTLLLQPQQNVSLVSAAKDLFNDRTKVGQQYRRGLIGNDFFGYDMVYQNTLLPTHTTGTEAGADTGADVNGANQTGSSVTVDGTTSATFKQGDIIMFAGCNKVHPETKADTGELQQFVVTSDVSSGYSSIPISPSIVTSGAKQNVSASPTDGGAVFKQESDESTGIGNAADYKIGLGYHRDAFTFATADLQMPDGVHFAAREVYDGISMRIVSDYDITNDDMLTRIDVLYGYKTIRPELACRVGTN